MGFHALQRSILWWDTKMTLIFSHGGVSGTAGQSVGSLPRYIPKITDTALDLVERTILLLEDEPRLNAGFGAVLNRTGNIELDAGLVEGRTGRVGAVANVCLRHPISLARLILEKTPHVLITGRAAELLAPDMEKLETATEQQIQRWEQAAATGNLGLTKFGAPQDVDTVGSVALDSYGTLAAGSSTGGVFGKMQGRVGDASVFGAGIYASPIVAVVGTGVGEAFMETLAAAEVGSRVADGEHPQSACEHVVDKIWRRSHVPAGLLALDANGQEGAAYIGASWAVQGPEGPIEAACLGSSLPPSSR